MKKHILQIYPQNLPVPFPIPLLPWKWRRPCVSMQILHNEMKWMCRNNQTEILIPWFHASMNSPRSWTNLNESRKNDCLIHAVLRHEPLHVLCLGVFFHQLRCWKAFKMNDFPQNSWIFLENREISYVYPLIFDSILKSCSALDLWTYKIKNWNLAKIEYLWSHF